MSLTTTTLSSAMSATDQFVVVASASSFAAGSFLMIDEEQLQIRQDYVSGTTVNVRRGINGTLPQAHPASANVKMGLGSDFTGPNASVVAPYPLAGKRRRIASYSASGAISLPAGSEDVVAILNGTSTINMTLAAPTQDQDGAIVYVIGNGKSASTLAVAGNNGVGNAGSGYRTLTFQTGGQVCVPLMACNGNWVALNGPYTGTSTSISVALS